MTRKLKLLIVDAIIVLVNILFFLLFDSNFIITFLFIAVSVVAHCMAHMLIPSDKPDTTASMNNIIENNDMSFETYMGDLREIKNGNPEFVNVINNFINQIKSFSMKEEALEKLINLNDDAAKTFLMTRNNEVQRFLIKSLKRFVKRLIVYNAKSRKNRTSSIEDDAIICEIFAKNDELIDSYDKLLDEVARMGDDLDLSDPGLQSVVENLRSLRGGNDEEQKSDDEDEFRLYVSTGVQ